MAYLQFEAMGVKRVKTKKSVAYIDHNTLQTGFENADDHYYIQTVTKKHGIYCSKPGNGICHQVQLERFGVPGYTLLGSDSHTRSHQNSRIKNCFSATPREMAGLLETAGNPKENLLNTLAAECAPFANAQVLHESLTKAVFAKLEKKQDV